MDVCRTIYDDTLFSWQPPVSCNSSAAPQQQACIAPADPLQTPPDIPAEFHRIWAILESHRGKDLAITAPQIAAAAGLWPDMASDNAGTKVRHILEICQDWWPWPVCGGSTGYYLAKTAADLTHYCANLRSRAMGDLRRFASFRRHGRRVGFLYLGHGRWADPEQPKGGPAIDHN